MFTKSFHQVPKLIPNRCCHRLSINMKSQYHNRQQDTTRFPNLGLFCDYLVHEGPITELNQIENESHLMDQLCRYTSKNMIKYYLRLVWIESGLGRSSCTDEAHGGVGRRQDPQLESGSRVPPATFLYRYCHLLGKVRSSQRVGNKNREQVCTFFYLLDRIFINYSKQI